MGHEVDVAGSVRAARLARGWTQRDLARRCGLSHTAIAKVERGEMSPTIASLQKIADSLDLSVTALISQGGGGREGHFFARGDLTVVDLGAHTIRQVGRNLSRHAMQMQEDTYAPGADTGDGMLSHAGEEAGIVIRGTLEVTVGDEVRVLGPGEAYLFESRLPHRFRNAGDETCVVVAAATPPSL
jgi:transcriptional regulator with XRE-family HTH domain